jgi:hypothetical protein
MSRPLAARLNAARQHRFVGRAEECLLFQSAISAAELPFHLLFIVGPGGVGKTTLLSEFARLCLQAGIPVLYLEGRSLQAQPEFLREALQSVGMDTSLQRQVLLIDTYEVLESLDNWLREQMLPQLPENTLIVLAGRNPPSAGWRSDAGWQSLLHVLPLRNLSPDESRTYLSRLQVPAEQHQQVIAFTHGHPLALSLVADVFAQGQDLHFQPDAVPDVVKLLLERFMQEVPSSSHRLALEACAMVRLTTEAVLAALLALPEVHDLFDWLRTLSFMEFSPAGLMPHELARDILATDLRWRHPDRYVELHNRARAYYTARLQQIQGQEQQRTLLDYFFLHRQNQAVRAYFNWQETGHLTTDVLQEADRLTLLQMVRRHEGEASADLAAYWLDRQPHGVLVMRDPEQQAVGFLMMLALHQTSLADQTHDPAVQAACTYLQHHAPLRSGEGATLFRFWIAQDTYQAVSPVQSLIFVNMVRHYRTSPGLAFTFIPCADPDFWAPMFAYADLMRIPSADFTVAGQGYGVYGHDWRVTPPEVWQDLLAQREITASAQIQLLPTHTTPLVVLSEAEFYEAVKDALRHYSTPDRLLRNPLLQSRLLAEIGAGSAASEQVVALQGLLKQVAESLQSTPRQDKLYRALYHTYLHPRLTQEQAAAVLDLPFSTFRRHLKAGIERVADILWQRELTASGR